MKPNPFVITFDDGADGGPEHLLCLLIGYAVSLYKDGDLLFEGTVVDTEAVSYPRFDNGTFVPSVVHSTVVNVRGFMPEGGDDGEVMSFDIFDSFDEVRYL